MVCSVKERVSLKVVTDTASSCTQPIRINECLTGLNKKNLTITAVLAKWIRHSDGAAVFMMK